MTAFRDAVFILTLLICAAGAEQMTPQSIQDMPIRDQVFFYKIMAESEFRKGEFDCHEGKPRKPNASDAYHCGYTHQEMNYE